MNRPLPLLVLAGLLLLFSASFAAAQDKKKARTSYKLVQNIPYRSGDSLTEYMREQCRLDLYFPEKQAKGYPTLIWFHGGGLTGGKRSIPEGLKNQNLAIVSVSYRLYPKIKAPVYLKDAAAATAWVFKNIETHGGSADRIYISGHSAGGYLTSMLGFDKRWLGSHDIDADRIAGLIPYSGHTITHFTVRKERGIDGKQPIIDDMAPLFHVRREAPPTLLVTGDRELEMLGRYEENAYFWRMLKVVGHESVDIKELQGYNHGQMAVPAHPLLLRFIDQLEKSRTKTESKDSDN